MVFYGYKFECNGGDVLWHRFNWYGMKCVLPQNLVYVVASMEWFGGMGLLILKSDDGLMK